MINLNRERMRDACEKVERCIMAECKISIFSILQAVTLKTNVFRKMLRSRLLISIFSILTQNVDRRKNAKECKTIYCADNFKVPLKKSSTQFIG